MARTLMRAVDADVLHSRSDLAFRNGKYLYRIKANDTAPQLTVTDGESTITANLVWAFGKARRYPPDETWLPRGRVVIGKLGQSYLFLQNGRGVACEACHGPGRKHVRAMEASQLEQGIGNEEGQRLIFNPGRLSPGDSVDFCGSCHGTWWDVKLTHLTGMANLRAQPYRLMQSKCWGEGDARLTCIACHNPHEPLSKDTASYDAKCLACHVASPMDKPNRDHPGPACPVGTKECANCHMPKIDIPEMHSAFADHLIRVVRKDAPIPD
jgi:hypothetical protein